MEQSRVPLPDAAFESRYLDYVAKAYDRVEIFGIDMQSRRAMRSWPLRDLYTDPMAFGDTGTPTETTAGIALAGRRRTLVRGAAGSGKTTLLWHMAVSAAQGQRTASDHLHEHIPFVLPVRSLQRRRQGLPRPKDFLDAARSVIADEQPAGWAERVLVAGRGLLLIDGVDEVGESERAGIRAWLGELLTAYPLCSYVVTTRTQAVPESWLSEWDFAALELGPLDPDGIRGLITRWYALNSADVGGPVEKAASAGRRDGLLAVVVERPDLREMVGNPLMCSLLCVVNERGGLRPRTHGELYGAVLSMMLGRRDEARAISAHDITSFREEAQILLLQHLAYWLQRNGRTETDLDRAGTLIAGLLRSMPGLAAERPPKLLAYLRERTGLLQETAPGRIGFAHRSFQAYLAAKEAVEQGDFGLLVDKADDPGWQDVVLMAFGHARRRDSTELFTSLLDRGERDPASRVRLDLLAAAALKYVHEVDPGIREQVEHRLAQLIPPRTPDEADALAEVGYLVVELMPGPDNLDPDGPEARMIVRTAQRIGGSAAHELVRRFVEARRLRAARVPRPAARPAAESVPVESWTTASQQGGYGARVLEIAGSDPPPDLDRLAYTVHHVVWRGAAAPYTVLGRLPLLRTLVIADSPALTDLDGLPRLPRLRTLRITGCPALRDLTALARTGVVFLDVAPNPGTAALAALAGVARLRVLGFPWLEGEFDLEALRRRLPGVELVPRSGVRT
ncbi:NACHT domain-containing NTPase [Streptomyces sp. TLI_146]|uniref:NACHT domain-containing protein n=1 Tax=Streptomyces sp. TLI_146 TaxID=1938858 RepID=UPI000C700B73|nr:NACHT domain-containing protein [Streptomyces sp. TLI_146]PKV89183.1 NACHT domain-containing protein [Streptomyces sp. TLI_146]